ncbi:MAG: DUF5671 domain-containing protein [Dehalococcoidia bacterium]
MPAAIGTGFFILWLALTMWVYFDATEHGKPAIAWAGVVFFLGWALLIPLILYLIFRETGHRWAVPPGSGRRVYLYVVSFAGYGMLAIGLSLLISTTIARALSEEAVGDDGYRQALASALAAIIIGAAVWASHWFRAESRLGSIADDQEFRATFFMHRSYLYTLFGLSWLLSFIFGLWFFGGLLANVFDVEGVELVGWLPALGPLSVALIAIGYHYSVHFETPAYKQLQARFASIPGPVVIAPSGETSFLGMQPAARPSASTPPSPAHAAPPPQSAATAEAAASRFCSQCGQEAQPADVFCSGCGARLKLAGA